jgi:ion channel-forming bestrophin family protein
LNLIVAFSYALKHRLRFEPYVEYEDMRGYVEFLDTFAKEANQGVSTTTKKPAKWKRFGEFLGISFAEDNPRKLLKQAKKPVGNLPLEILVYLQGYLDTIIDNGTLKTPIFQVQSRTSLPESLCIVDARLSQ